VTIISLSETNPLAIGTKNGIVKRVRSENSSKDVFSVIALKEGDRVIGAGYAADDDELVFISSDSNLLRFSAKTVRPQGNSGMGMAGIKLVDKNESIYFGVVNKADVDERSYVVTVAGNSGALEWTEAGFAKVTPYALYPMKGRASQGVRSQRFLKGQNTLILARVTTSLHASDAQGEPVELPEINERRDASGEKMNSRIFL
jgi:DNA gyrase subunit A